MGVFDKIRPKPAVHPVTVGDNNVAADPYTSDSEPSIIHDGDLAFQRVKGGNNSGATYQEAVGAPVESQSPLGYHVGWAGIMFLNINQMIGTGIFSTRTYLSLLAT
jgi:hypothetical protein